MASTPLDRDPAQPDAPGSRDVEQALRQSEERFRSLTALSSDWYWEQDENLRFTYVSGQSESATGRRVAAALGKTRWELDYVASEATWIAHRQDLAARRPFRDLELMRIDADGRQRWSTLSGQAVFDDTGRFKGYCGIGRDITAQKRTEQLRALELTAARLFAENPKARDALKAAIQAICETEHWDCARYLWVDAAAGVLRFGEAWSVADADIERYIEESRSMVYAPGVGLAGKVWQSRQPVWTVDIENDPRVARPALAQKTGMRSGFVVPVAAEGNTIGVLVFQSRHSREPDEQVLNTMQVVGGQIGLFVQRSQAEQALQQSEARFRSLTGLSADWYWEQDECFRFANLAGPGAAAMARGGDPSVYLGKARWEIPDLEPIEGDWSQHRAQLERHEPFRDVLMRRRMDDGTTRYMSVSGEPLFDPAGRFAGYRGVAKNVTAKVEADQRLARLAQFDSLTGLPNRALLSDRFSQLIVQARRHGRSLGVLFIDLDRFKMVNDTLGHAGGDELLKETARRLQASVRTGDTVARISGDEFAVILGDLARIEDAAIVAQKMIERLAQPFSLLGRETFVTASIGIAAFPADGDDAEALLAAADAAMYRAKESGRNAYEFFTAEISQRTHRRARLGSELRRALEREELALAYQPKLELASGAVCGAEALLRWRHPQQGELLPGEFIPVLEETGLIVPAGEWVLRRACADLRARQAAGIPLLPVAVNLSARQFRQPDLDGRIRSLLRGEGIDPRLIELEITESQLMEDPDYAIRVMHALRSEGIGIALDDFGTGYSSLSYLTRFPLTAVKIDRSFVAGIRSADGDSVIVRTIIEMAHTLGLTVVAEGVEEENQAAYLRRHGCEQAQGYLFARPMPAADFDRLISLPRPAAHGLAGSTRKFPASKRT